MKFDIQYHLDISDYWARTFWHQMQPIWIEKKPYMDETRFEPFVSENDFNIYPDNFSYHAKREGHMWANDVYFMRDKKKKKCKNYFKI